MRVVAGTARGMKLKGPPTIGTRPMADKIKEALFGTLDALGVDYGRVLDLYAGTGSVGIEALSRGGEWADFVERTAPACAVIRENLTHTKLAQKARVNQSSVNAFLARKGEPYDFVILDPPYADADILEVLERIGESPLVADRTIVVVGHWPKLQMPERLGKLERLKQRCHGDSCFAVYEVVDETAAAADVEGEGDAPDDARDLPGVV